MRKDNDNGSRRTKFFCLLTITLCILLSGCQSIAMLMGEDLAITAAEVAEIPTITGVEASLVESAFVRTAAGEVAIGNPEAANALLGRIRLVKAPKTLPRLFIEGQSEPFAEVYAKQGKFKMLRNGTLHTIPDNIFSVIGKRVNVRSGYTASSNIVTTVRQDDLMVKLAEEKGWYQIQVVKNSKTYTGWINAAYAVALVDLSDKESPSIAPGAENARNLLTKSALSCRKEAQQFSNWIFRDNFFDNHNDWRVDNTTEPRAYFENGGYVLNNQLQSTFLYSLKKDPSLLIKDYYIVLNSRHLSGNTQNGHGIIFNYQDRGNFYGFFLSAEGTYIVFRMANHKLIKLIPWTTCSRISTETGANNSMGVQICNEFCLFSINHATVDAIKDFHKEGDVFGFGNDSEQVTMFLSINVMVN